MGVKGRLSPAQFGFSMPVHAPLYPAPPFQYKDARLIYFNYVTDPSVASAVIPDCFELADPPTALVAFASYPWSSLGPYNEVVQVVDVVYKGKPLKYSLHLYVTTDQAMAAGREVGGYPKKIANIEFESLVSYLGKIERPPGLLLATGTMRPEIPVPATFPMTHEYVCVRQFPSPIAGAAPTLRELLISRWVLQSGELWEGPGTCVLTGASILDPLHAVPIVKPAGSLYFQGDFQVIPSKAGDEIPI